MWYWWSVNENSLKYKIENLYENLFTASQSFMEIAILFVVKWNDIVYKKGWNKLYFMSVTVNK